MVLYTFFIFFSIVVLAHCKMDMFVQNLSKLLLDYNETSVNTKCPLFVATNVATAGLGDRLEQAIFARHFARKFRATFVLINGFGKINHEHNGGDDYSRIARYLGVNFLEWSHVEAIYKPFTLKLNYMELTTLYNDITVHKNNSLRCNTILEVTLWSCLLNNHTNHYSWCHGSSEYRENDLEEAMMIARGHKIGEKCLRDGLGFPAREANNDSLIVITHLRSGDICLGCHLSYFQTLQRTLMKSFRFHESNIGQSVHLAIEAQVNLTLFEDPFFKNYDFYLPSQNNSLLDTICRFLTADVLVTTGSSFPMMIAMYGLPSMPIVMEESIKFRRARHYLSSSLDVNLVDGVPVDVSYNEIFQMLPTSVQARLS